MDYDSLRKQVLAGKPLAFDVDGLRPNPAQAARDEFAAEEWRRLVELEKARILRTRSFWFWIRNLVMRRITVTVHWRNPT